MGISKIPTVCPYCKKKLDVGGLGRIDHILKCADKQKDNPDQHTDGGTSK